MRLTRENADALYGRLTTKFATHLLCRPDTRLIVEGYPRSSNSFTVDMIAECGTDRIRRSEMAHHTHLVEHLRIAEAYGVPKLILIRDPQAAILSFHIYSGLPIKRCVEKYHDFYKAALNMMNRSAVATFDEITSDFAPVIAKINAIGDFGISEDQDFGAARERALALVRSRASTDPEEAMRQTAAPDEMRDKLKGQLREAVQSELSVQPEIHSVYEAVMAHA